MPPQLQMANDLDAVQRRMVAIALRLTPANGETREQFTCRRGRAARQLCLQSGLWSRRWFRRALNWDGHDRRERNGFMWTAKLVPSFALSCLPSGLSSSPYGPQIQPGYVKHRCHDGISFAHCLHARNTVLKLSLLIHWHSLVQFSSIVLCVHRLIRCLPTNTKRTNNIAVS